MPAHHWASNGVLKLDCHQQHWREQSCHCPSWDTCTHCWCADATPNSRSFARPVESPSTLFIFYLIYLAVLAFSKHHSLCKKACRTHFSWTRPGVCCHCSSAVKLALPRPERGLVVVLVLNPLNTVSFNLNGLQHHVFPVFHHFPSHRRKGWCIQLFRYPQ